MAFRFQNVEGDDESVKLARLIAEDTPDSIVEVCGLSQKDALFAHVLASAMPLVLSLQLTRTIRINAKRRLSVLYK
jgi:hypothetical protein